MRPRIPIRPRQRPTPGDMGGLERQYADLLQLRKRAGEIVDYRYEAIKLKLAPNTFYTPDFVVTFEDRIELHETKGHWEDDARVKVKVASAMFPWFRFVGARWDKNVKDWKFEEFTA